MGFTVRNLNVDYDIKGEGKPIVILHKSMIGRIEPIFKEKTGWKRIYVNYPGIGKSEVGNNIESSQDILEILLDFIELMTGQEEFLLIGYSYGSYLARGILNRKFYQVKGIALICPVIFAERDKRNILTNDIFFKDEEFIKTLTDEEAEGISNYVVQNKFVWERAQELERGDTNTINIAFYNRLKAKSRYEYDFDVDDLPMPFEGPTLILLGKQDDVVGYKDAWNTFHNYPRATFAILDMAGHNLDVEQGILFHELIADWIKRVELL